ncbi:MAG: cytochrome c3 family protein, partial [Planctomycetes bacterium]|nr:cytochrome c3 family protein [Planctomycetota bacterium]
MGPLFLGGDTRFHAFDFEKYAHRYLGEFQYRFNRWFDLSGMSKCLVLAAALIRHGSRTQIHHLQRKRSMKKIVWLAGWLVALFFGVAQGAIVDAPHNEANEIACGSCHTYSMWWQYSPIRQAKNPGREAIVNTVCLTCHGSTGPAPTAMGHSGAIIGSTTYHGGLWSQSCTDCHTPHEQDQLLWLSAGVNPYLVTGKIDSVAVNTPVTGQTTITYSGQSNNPLLSTWPASDWSNKSNANPGRGLILVHNKTEAFNTFSVLSATTTKMVIRGTISAADISTTSCPQTSLCAEANTFGLLYGQLIRKDIRTPNSGNRAVKFLDGRGGFSDPVNKPPTGICQVCHTLTHYWDNSGNNVTHNVGVNCTACHPHKDGFKPGFPPHETFVVGQAQCTDCHNGANRVLDIHKGDCIHCHTTPPILAKPTERSNVIAIDRGDCFTCHGPSFHDTNVAHNHRKVVASCASCHAVETTADVDTLHKVCTNCHGYSGSKLNPTTVANAIATGRGSTGTDVNCQTCHTVGHNTDTAHDKRQTVGICASCHAIGSATAIDTLHKACATCHTSAKSVVVAAIAAGRAGTVVFCTTCHSGAGGSADTHGTTNATAATSHDKFDASTACASCHVIGTAEQRLTLHSVCTTCHSSTKTLVVAAITAGRAGTAVQCTTCHSGAGGSADTHGTT